MFMGAFFYSLRYTSLMNTVFVFGNPDLEMDALPIQIMPLLAKRRADLVFSVKDPNEDWNIPETLMIIDTVVGIDHLVVFSGLTDFAAAAHVSVHDFDAYANLRFLQKLGKLKEVRIIGLPVGMEANSAVEEVLKVLAPVT